jgi:hypothetical protein
MRPRARDQASCTMLEYVKPNRSASLRISSSISRGSLSERFLSPIVSLIGARSTAREPRSTNAVRSPESSGR